MKGARRLLKLESLVGLRPLVGSEQRAEMQAWAAFAERLKRSSASPKARLPYAAPMGKRFEQMRV